MPAPSVHYREAMLHFFQQDPTVTPTFLSKQVGVCRETARIWLAKFNAGDTSLKDAPRAGRPRALSTAEHNAVKRHASTTKGACIRSATRLVNRKRGKGCQVSERTIRRSVKAGLRYGQARARPISEDNVRRRTEETTPKKVRKMKQILDRCIFTDASFVRFRPGHRISAHRNTKCWQQAGVPSTAKPRGNLQLVQFYAGVTVTSTGQVFRSRLLWVPPSPQPLTTATSLDSECYQKHVCTPLQAWAKHSLPTDDPYYLQDGEKIHTSRSTKAWQQQNGMKLAPHPPQSPDLNPIEHCWALLKDRVEGRFPKTWETFVELMQKEWCNIPDECIRQVVTDLPARMKQVHGQPDKHAN